jgi:putative spermidine/putrescine transport system permease protein
VVEPAPAPEAIEPRPLRAGRSRERGRFSWLGVAPFFAFVGLFLLFPTVIVATEALKSADGGWSLANLGKALSGEYRSAFVTTAELAAVTALLGGLFGSLLAYAIVALERPRFLHHTVTTFSGVASQLGGIPLAFAFIATLGAQGTVTVFLRDHVGINLSDLGFDLFSFRGLAVVYLYFQIPLMVIVMLPAIEGMKPAWREAASNLGASRVGFWRHVGLPILSPTALAGFVLLFANAFAAYATAYALTAGQVNLVAIQIGFFLSGNVLDDPGLGYAIAFWMIVVIALAITAYQLLQRRTARWLR